MKLSNLRNEDLQEIAMLKTRKGTATSEAKRAQQILRTRDITHGGYFNSGSSAINSSTDMNPERNYQTFEEVHGCTLELYLATHKRQGGRR